MIDVYRIVIESDEVELGPFDREFWDCRVHAERAVEAWTREAEEKGEPLVFRIDKIESPLETLPGADLHQALRYSHPVAAAIANRLGGLEAYVEDYPDDVKGLSREDVIGCIERWEW